ncbi:transposable element Tcb2 transposase [Trichonephila clavipes]|nr:transposable element Tcb2 transposase [Trichonephila clavipes]
MKAKRSKWAKQWRDKDVDFKRSVCFSDESTFEILQNKAQFVRRRGEKFHSDCFVQTVKHPTKIMIWSVISGKGTERLDMIKGMMWQEQYKDILQNRFISLLEEWCPNGEPHIFMQGGAPCHTARSIKAFLAEQNILLLDWPGNSPDMNTIENVWELMKREVAKDVITNKTQLLERIIHVWHHHPQMKETVQSCIQMRLIIWPGTVVVFVKSNEANLKVKSLLFALEDFSFEDNAGQHAVLLARWIVRRVPLEIVGSSGHVKVPTHGKPGLERPGRPRGEMIARQKLVDPTMTRSTIRADVGVAIVPQTIYRHLAEANQIGKRICLVMNPGLTFPKWSPRIIFQQDNARPHTARVAQDFLRHFQTLPCPACSPDLSPVEHEWDQLKMQMPSCHSVHDLELAVQNLWTQLPQDNIRCLINSMPDRVAACIAAGGGPTRY